LVGPAADRFGRKKLLIADAGIYATGAIMPDSAIATAYIAEYAPNNRRGSLAMLQQWTITVGILISYLASRRRSEACPSWPWCCSARRSGGPAGRGPAGVTVSIVIPR
jgi:MFS family permease